ncbi:MAG: hypothetical protein AAB955_01935 [Patescibacteria group bacterium]
MTLRSQSEVVADAVGTAQRAGAVESNVFRALVVAVVVDAALVGLSVLDTEFVPLTIIAIIGTCMIGMQYKRTRHTSAERSQDAEREARDLW